LDRYLAELIWKNKNEKKRKSLVLQFDVGMVDIFPFNITAANEIVFSIDANAGI
jgi:hypothetical protein